MACSTALLAPPITAWLIAVDVGDHHVAVDRLQDSLDFVERRKHGRHPAVVFHRHRVISRPRALTASSASSKGRAPDATSAPYSPRLCPIVMSGWMP